MKLSTILNHPPRVELKGDNEAMIAPIYQTAKFAMADAPYGDQFIYTRVSNPTLRELELTLAKVQGTEDAIVFASGMAAISHTLLALLSMGDHAIFFREIYKPARMFFNHTVKRFGIESTMMSLDQLDDLEKNIRPGKTKMIYFESPTNPNLRVADISKLRSLCEKHKILLVMDNTLAGPHQHRDMGIDIYIHSLTKFVNGHGDLVAGAVMCSNDLSKKLRPMTITLGATLDPHAAFLIQRGLRTFDLRYTKQTQNAEELVKYLSTHKKVAKVHYPKGELASKQMKQFGGIVSIELEPSAGPAREFCHKMNMIKLAVSLGSSETLINPSEIFFAEDLSQKDREEMGLNQYSIRISVGLEDAQDIIADFEQAFK